jgi:hypothetical protein
MQFDWSTLGAKAPTALVRARNLTHHAVQWVAKAARANLDAAPDDSHASLTWAVQSGTFLSQPLPANGAQIRIGFRPRGFALVLTRNDRPLDEFELGGRKDTSVAVWFDSALRALGLKPAGDIELPYTLPSLPVSRGSAYHVSGETEAFDELANWFDAAADLLADVAAVHPGAGPVRCWPQHLDIATLIALDGGEGEAARSIGVGVSPGDAHYAQPYVYVSPSPRLKPAALPPLPPPGHWHLKDFVAAVATAEAIIVQPERGPLVRAFVDAAIEIGRARLQEASGAS